MSNLSQSGGNANSGEISSQNSPFLHALGLSITPNGGNPDNAVPSGYLKSVFYKHDGTPVVASLKLKHLQAGAGQWQTLELSYTAPDRGYVQVFVANESDQTVYFDDLEVEHTPQLIVQENHYYPFGLELAGLNKLNQPEHRWKFQGQEHQTEFGLNWAQFKYRNHDLALGRFFSIDPLAEKYVYNSTYAFAENKLGLGRELEGLELNRDRGKSAWNKAYENNDEYNYWRIPAQQEGPGWVQGGKSTLRTVIVGGTKLAIEIATFELGFALLKSAPKIFRVLTKTKSGKSLVKKLLDGAKAGKGAKPKFKNGPGAKVADEFSKGISIEIEGVEHSVYRGGTDMNLKPGEYKVTPKGKYPARGLSLNGDAESISKWDPHQVVSIPDELTIIHTPSKNFPKHIDIIPKNPSMSQEQYQKLLKQVKLRKIK